jgi:hypothetical protein
MKLQELAVKTAKCVFGIGDDPDCPQTTQENKNSNYNVKFVQGKKRSNNNNTSSNNNNTSSNNNNTSSNRNNSLTNYNRTSDQIGTIGLDPLELEEGKGHYFIIFLLMLLGAAFTIGDEEEK